MEYLFLNQIYCIFTNLKFKERYYLSLTNKKYWELFKKYKHNEVILISANKYKLINKWSNIKFKCILNINNINYSDLPNVNNNNLILHYKFEINHKFKYYLN